MQEIVSAYRKHLKQANSTRPGKQDWVGIRLQGAHTTPKGVLLDLEIRGRTTWEEKRASFQGEFNIFENSEPLLSVSIAATSDFLGDDGSHALTLALAERVTQGFLGGGMVCVVTQADVWD